MRRIAVVVLMGLGTVLPAVAVASWWAYGQATDTERFDEAARPLATDQTVQDAVVDRVVSDVGERVPAALMPQVRSAAQLIVATEAYRRTWRELQRHLHERFAERLAAGSDAPLVLDLAPVAALLRQRVAAAGIPRALADRIPDPSPVQIADRQQVREARRATSAVHTVRTIAIPAAIVALLAVLLTAGGVSRGLLRLAACLAGATILLVAGWIAARGAIHDQDPDGPLAAAIFDILARPLRTWAITGAAAGIACGILGGALTLRHD